MRVVNPRQTRSTVSEPNGTKQETPQESPNQLAIREKHDNIRAGIGGGQPMALVPTSFLEAQSMAGALAASDLVPKAYRDKPANVLLAIMSGAELGFGPLASMRAFHVIEGTPRLSARALAALVMKSGLAEYFEPVGEPTATSATWRTKRVGRGEQTRTWTIEQAQKAGIAGKDNWRNYPHRMLSARSSKDLADDIYPELTMGLMLVEEEETPIGDQVFSAPPPPPPPQQKAPKAGRIERKKDDNVIDADFTESKTSSAPASSSTSSGSSSVASNPPPNAGATIGDPPPKVSPGASGHPDPGAADALAKARENAAAIDKARAERAAEPKTDRDPQIITPAAGQDNATASGTMGANDDGFGEDEPAASTTIGPDPSLSVEDNYRKFERELAACTKESIAVPMGQGIKLWVPWSKKDGQGAAYGQQMRDAFSRRKQDLGA